MNSRKVVIAFVLLLAPLIISLVARADEWDQASKLTFNQEIHVPGRVLPAGTYWFILADSVNDRNIVQVFNADRSVLYATIKTISASRIEASGHTTITFTKRDSTPANTMLTWFYPGSKFGHEFLYSKPEQRELAGAKQQTIMATASGQTLVTGD